MQDSKGLLAITVSIAVFIVWYSFVVPKFWPQEKKAPVEQQEVVKKDVTPEKAPSETPVIEKETAPQDKDIKEVVSVLGNDKFTATFTNYGALPTRWDLNKYTITVDKKEETVDLVGPDEFSQKPLEVSFERSDFNVPSVPRYRLIEEKKDMLKYRWSSDKIMIEKIYTLGEHEYDVNLKVIIKNIGKETITERISLGWTAAIHEEKKGGILGFLKSPSDIKMPVYMLDGKVSREMNPAKLKEAEFRAGKLYWVGIEDRYFLASIVPRLEAEGSGVRLAVLKNKTLSGFYSGILLPEAEIAPQGSHEDELTIYAGPKEMSILKGVGMNLDKAIDYGWFTVIAIPILYILKFLYSIVHNYGIAIILLTILIKILLNPISKKSMKSMKGMKDLQPRLKELKEKYKGNKEKLNVEMMQLFKAHKVNPMSGCLPMVLQLPVYIALYRVLWNSIELYHAPFFWFYKDLSQPDPYFITPVILGIAMFFQQKMTPAATADPAQQKMMQIMPLMFCVFLAFLPVGLVVYILVNTVMSVVQQWMSNNDITWRDLVHGRFSKKVRT